MIISTSVTQSLKRILELFPRVEQSVQKLVQRGIQVLSDVPKVKAETLKMVFPSLSPGSFQHVPTFLFQGPRKVTFLVPQSASADINFISLAGVDAEEIVVLLENGPLVSAAIFSRLVGSSSEFARVVKANKAIRQASLYSLDEARRLHTVLDRSVSELFGLGLAGPVFHQAGFQHIGQVVQRTAAELKELLREATRRHQPQIADPAKFADGLPRLFERKLPELSAQAGRPLRLGMSPEELLGWQPPAAGH